MSHFSRRRFLQAGMVGAAVATRTVMLPELSFAQESAARPVRFGIIGVGMHGSGLLANAISLPGTECMAACDVYDARQTLAREIVRPDLPATRRYQALLENQNIDAVIVAVPDHWHRQIVLDALSAGKDIYCEKPLTHSAEQGNEIIAAAKKSNRILQVGSQRTSSAVYGKAREIYQAGGIGRLSMVEAQLGRNDPTGAWVYPVPPGLSPANLDWETWLGPAPKRAFDAIRFTRWRCYSDYGTGLAGDLAVHMLSGIQYVLGMNEPPKLAMGLGGNVRWKDGRDALDLHAVLLQFGEMPVVLRLTQDTDIPESTRFLGSGGILEITESSVIHTPQPGVDLAPSYYMSSFPSEMREQYLREWYAKNAPTPGKEHIFESTRYRSISYNDLKPHLWNFFEAVRSRKPVVQDAVFGHHAALPCHMANQSHAHGKPVVYDAQSGQIKPA